MAFIEVMASLFCPFIYCLPWVTLFLVLIFNTLVVQVYMCGLLAKFVRSRWLDIGQVLFLRVYGPRRSRGP